jgi:thiol-disulfide isomerase/thioredoxin
MRLHSALPFLIPALLAAQAPAQDARALTASYTTLLKGYATKVAEAEKAKRPFLGETPYQVSVRIAHESDPQVRQVLMMARHFMLKAEGDRAGKIPDAVHDYVFAVENSALLELAGQISPDSPALTMVADLDPELLGYIAWHVSGGGFAAQSEMAAATKAFAFYDAVFEKHPEHRVKLLALKSCIELHSRPQDIEGVRAVLARLEAFEPQDPSISTWKSWLVRAAEAEKTAPRVGNPVPAFQLQDLDHPGVTFTPKTFKGKYYLIDFWATWCGPCKRELPFVHRAYAKFHPAGLEILSISRDRKVEDIRAFRKDKEHPMPWHHAFPQGKAGDDLMDRFQVRGIPHIVLVGPDGKILALEDLRGEDLEKTLGKYLKTH